MNSSPEEALFALALAKPAEKRAAHEQPASELAGSDANRRDEFHESHKPSKSHESPANDQDLTELDPPNELDETVGQTLGRFKLLERVGEGGCGVVHIAEQTEPARRAEDHQAGHGHEPIIRRCRVSIGTGETSREARGVAPRWKVFHRHKKTRRRIPPGVCNNNQSISCAIP